MKEIYDWVPWFRELTGEILKAGETGLITQARQVDWGDKPASLLAFGDQGIDPFSFMYFLAQKNTTNQRPRVYPSVAKCFGLKSPLPDLDNGDFYTFPSPSPRAAALFHDGEDYSPKLLWKLFRQTVEDKPQIDATFGKALEIKYVAVTKLTHALFLINPNCFVPTDTLQHVPANKDRDLNSCDHDAYLSAIEQAKQTFLGCHMYEINMFLYLQYMSKHRLLTAESRFFQISTHAHETDCWQDFDRSHAVYTDASAPGTVGAWDERTNGGDSRHAPYPLTEPKRGDIILVRTGSRGRAIGIVYRNDYAEPDGLNDRSRLHVCWINKAQASFSGAQIDQRTFSQAEPGSSIYKAFATAAPYELTFELMKNVGVPPVVVPPPSPLPSVHPLNLILYGPPGTGKTWRTVTRAVAIVENRHVLEVEKEEREDRAAIKCRFDQHRGAGRIEMVTFHQNTTYEDFVEGIRPVLTEPRERGAETSAERKDVGEVQYELSRGVFRRIAERATLDPNRRYVLVIDEINRGNVARIFGELITLIEDSKRIGQDDEARVTLPGSKTEFGVPANLHVGRLQRTANPREHAESMQGQRLLEPFVQARNRRLVELVQLSPHRFQVPLRLLVGGPLVGSLQTSTPGLLLGAWQVRDHILSLVPLAALDKHLAPEHRRHCRLQPLGAVDHDQRSGRQIESPILQGAQKARDHPGVLRFRLHESRKHLVSPHRHG